MRKSPDQHTAKLSRQDWVTSARRILIDKGVDDVKVDRLATQLRVTRGSFYWHFRDHEDLLSALLKDWDDRSISEINQIRSRWLAGKPDLSEVVKIWLSEDPSFPVFGMAVRAWAKKSSVVAETVRKIDDAWIFLLREIFLNAGYGETESLVRARITYFHQIGYYALGISEKISDRLSLVPYYYEALTGFKAPSNLLDGVQLPIDLVKGRPQKKQRVERRSLNSGRPRSAPKAHI